MSELSRNPLGLSRKDLEYQEMVNRENKKLIDNMTTSQKQMLADVEKMFPPSKLSIDEDA